jgi:hypothetical protein
VVQVVAVEKKIAEINAVLQFVIMISVRKFVPDREKDVDIDALDHAKNI